MNFPRFCRRPAGGQRQDAHLPGARGGLRQAGAAAWRPSRRARLHRRRLAVVAPAGRAATSTCSSCRPRTSCGLGGLGRPGRRGGHRGQSRPVRRDGRPGHYSTAELAKCSHARWCWPSTAPRPSRTVAALVLGCQRLDPEVPLAAWSSTRRPAAGTSRVLARSHRRSAACRCWGPFPGCPNSPSRNGTWASFRPRSTTRLPGHRPGGRVAEEYLDLDALEAPGPRLRRWNHLDASRPSSGKPREPPRIGVFRDAAFQFYYPENLEALVREGATLVEISPFRDAAVPDVDALYIGGGFPETLAPALTENQAFLESLRRAVDRGCRSTPSAAGRASSWAETRGRREAVPHGGRAARGLRPPRETAGHGYAELETVASNPFFPGRDPARARVPLHVHSRAAKDLRFAFGSAEAMDWTVSRTAFVTATCWPRTLTSTPGVPSRPRRWFVPLRRSGCLGAVTGAGHQHGAYCCRWFWGQRPVQSTSARRVECPFMRFSPWFMCA